MTVKVQPSRTIKTMVEQIGMMNILAISGGRKVIINDSTLALPVSHGYQVIVSLKGNDTYTVQRVFTRGSKVWIKGEATDIYCEDLGEVAYRASCYVNLPFGEYSSDM